MDAAIIKRELFEQFPAFIKLLFMADEKGQIVTSSRQLAKELGMGRQQVRTMVKKMVVTHLVTHLVTHQSIVLTICNYDSYDAEKIATNPPSNPPNNPPQKKESSPLNDIYISKPLIEKEKPDGERNIETKTSLVSNKERDGENRKKQFIPPTLDEVKVLFSEKNQDASEAESFYYYWESVNWYRGKERMKNWKAAASQWIINKTKRYRNYGQRPTVAEQFEQLGQRLAKESAREIEQERNGKGRELPPDLRGIW